MPRPPWFPRTAVGRAAVAAIVGLTVATVLSVGAAPATATPGASTVGAAARGECDSPASCYAAAFDAYVFTLPLTMTVRSAEVATNVHAPSPAGAPGGRAPMNQFARNGIPDSSFTDIVLPSVSTPYANAFLDLGKEPQVLTIPDIAGHPLPDGRDRFFLFQVLDAWTQVGGESDACRQGSDGFCGLGTRYHTQAGSYLFARTGWKGKVPPGIRQVVYIDSTLGWIAGRTLTDGTPADQQTVTALERQYTLTPLSKFGKAYTPPQWVPTDPRLDMSTPAVTQVEDMSARTYLETTAGYLGPNPPTAADAPAVAAMARIGLVPGKRFVWQRLDAMQRAAVERGYDEARQLVVETARSSPPGTTWKMALHDGSWPATPAGYLQRAVVAYGGLGANLYADAVYAGTLTDADGDPLGGGGCYRLTFAQLPPTSPDAFWSVTLYNRPGENLFAAPNGRNGVGIPSTQGNSLALNGDGSVDIYVQPTAPAAGPDSTAGHNWLPSPPASATPDGFLLLLRMYMPQQALFDGAWTPPAVQKAACQ